MTQTHHYRLGGLRLGSELALPELPRLDATLLPPEIVFQLGAVPAHLERPDHVGPVTEIQGERFLLRLDGVGRYLVKAGQQITIEPARHADERALRLFLLGSAFGALLHQRGLLPLHASAVRVQGKAVAFVGESGAGKSTLAALLQRRGYTIISDDICVLSMAADGEIHLHPDIPRLKLWRKSLDYLSQPAQSLEPVRTGLEKYLLPIPQNPTQPSSGSVPLAAIYRLQQERVVLDQMRIQRESKATGVQIIINNTYRSSMLDRMGQRPRQFMQASRIAACTPVYSYSRALDLTQVDAQLDLLENHWTSPNTP